MDQNEQSANEEEQSFEAEPNLQEVLYVVKELSSLLHDLKDSQQSRELD